MYPIHQPILKTVKPINFLFHRAQVTIADLVNQIPMARKLFAEAVKHDLHVTGPVHWHYFGFMGDESQSFQLEIALPVAALVSEYDGPFHFKRTDVYTCLSLVHEGSWQEIPQSYGKLMQYMADHRLQPSGINRELYINADFQQGDANVTEIQMGINSSVL
jgi:effector-binding domain-containing protein